MNSPVIAIVGPTASGKSDLALRLAKKYKGVIISADSRQVYKYLNIGANKPSRAERKRIRHFGLDLVSPDQTFTLADFLAYAQTTLPKVWSEGKIPFIVGGTGLYVRALLENYQLQGANSNPKLRSSLEKKTTAQLVAKLKKLSLSKAAHIDLHNRRRVIRAIEQLQNKPTPSSEQLPPQFRSLQIGVSVDRAQLYQRIDSRVDSMINKGLIAEVKRLAKKYDWSLPAMSGIGYSQIGQWLRGEITRKKAIELIKRDTRHYAKRQLTWFRRDHKIHWVQNAAQAEQLVKKFVE